MHAEKPVHVANLALIKPCQPNAAAQPSLLHEALAKLLLRHCPESYAGKASARQKIRIQIKAKQCRGQTIYTEQW